MPNRALADDCGQPGWSLTLNASTINCGDGIALGVSSNGAAGNKYKVVWGDGVVEYTQSPLNTTTQIPHTYTRPGTYTLWLVRIFTAAPCRDSASIQLIVTSTLPNPTVSHTAACNNQNFTLTATNYTVGDEVSWYEGTSSTPFSQSTSSGITTLSKPAGTYDFKVRYKRNQCLSDLINYTVVVHPIPAAPTFTFTGDNACGPATVNFSVTNPVGGTSYIFRVGHNNNQEIFSSSGQYTYPSVVGGGSDTYTLSCLAVANGCTSAVSQQTVTVKQVPDVSILNPLTGDDQFNNCNLASRSAPTYDVTVSMTSATSSTNASYEINWGDQTPVYTSNTAADANHTYTSFGIYNMTVKVTGTNGCVSSKTYQVINISNPSIGLTNQGSTTGCLPQTFTFLIDTAQTNRNHFTTTYEVDYGDGSPLETYSHPAPRELTHTFNVTSCGNTFNGSSNTFGVTVRAINLCKTTPATVGGIQIFRAPRAAFTVQSRQACVGASVRFTNTTILGFNSSCNRFTNFTWRFEPGITRLSNNPNNSNSVNDVQNYTFSSPGIYVVELTATNTTCQPTVFRDTICVSPTPVVDFRTIFPSSGTTTCTGQGVQFQNRTNLIAQPCGAPTYTWSISTTDNHGGCNDPAVGTAFVFTNGTSATSVSPSVRFNLPGTYRVRLQVTNPCSTLTKDTNIVIKGRPFISGGLSGVSNYCLGGSITPTATVNNCNGSTALTYSWLLNGTQISTSASPGTFNQAVGTYTLTLITTNECGHDTATASYRVSPLPTITTQPVNASVCAGVSTSFQVVASTTESPNTLIYQWELSTNGGTTWQSVPNNTTYSGATTATLSLNAPAASLSGNLYRVRVSGSSGCSVTSSSASLTVNPLASITAQPIPRVVCAGLPASFTVQASGPGISYQWQVSTDNGTNWANVSGATSDVLTLGTLTTASNGYLYRVILTTTGNCNVTSAVVPLTVLATPTITTNLPSSADVCVGGTVTLTAEFSSGTNFRWFQNSGSGYVALFNNGTFSGTSTNSLTITNVPSGFNGRTYRLVGTHPITGCEVNTQELTLNVNALPQITTQPSNATVCENSSASFTAVFNASPAISTFQWQVSSSVGGPFTDISNGSTYSGTTTATLAVDPVTANLDGLYYRLVATTAKACTSITNAAQLRMVPLPVISTQAENRNVCEGQNIGFGVIASGNALSYQWQISTNNGSSWTDLTNTAPYSNVTSSVLLINNVPNSLNNNRYRVRVTNTVSGVSCTINSASGTLTVNPLPTASISSNLNNVCAGTPISLTASGGTTYTWDADPTLSTTTGSVVTATPTVNTTYFVTVTDGNSCSKRESITITVNPLPTVTLVTSSPVLVCENQELKLEVQTVTGATYQWYLNNTAISGATAAVYTVANATTANAGTYRVEITTTATSCKASSSNITVTVNSQPNNFTVSGGGSYCAGGSGVNITLSSSQSGIRYDLLLGGIATGVSLTGTGSALTFTGVTAAGSYTISAFSGESCTRLMTGNATVTVLPLPTATITTSPVTICTGQSFTLNANTGTGLSYQWFKDGVLISGATSATYGPVVAGVSLAGNYTVQVTNTSTTPNCSATSNPVSVTVNPRPDISAQPVNATVCENGSTSFSVAATGTSLTYQWQEFVSSTWADIAGAVSNQLNLSGVSLAQNNRGYRVKITNGNSCDTLSAEAILRVNPLPNATITSTKQTICLNENTTLTASGGTTYTWDPDPTLSATSGSVVTATPTVNTTYFVTVTDGNNCSKRESITITVNPLPTVTLVTSSPVLVCENTELKLEVQTVTGATYQWYLNNTAISGATGAVYTVASATTANAGTYRVEITTTATSCKASSSNITVTVNPQPIAYTVGGGGSYCAGGSGVNITLSGSQSGIRYDLLLGGSATGVSLTGTGSALTFTGITAAGSYTISAFSGESCTRLMTGSATVTVLPLPTATITTLPVTICTGQSFTLNANTGTGLSYQWFKDGSPISGATSATYGPIVAGVSLAGNYTVQVTNTSTTPNCSATSSPVSVIINTRPGITTQPVNVTVCENGSTSFSVAATGTSLTYQWQEFVSSTWADIAGAVNDQLNLTTVTLAQNNRGYRVKITNGNSCDTLSAEAILRVNPLPNATITSTKQTICLNENTTLTASGGTTYTWDADPTLSTTTGSVVTATPIVTTTYFVTVTDGNNCSKRESITITVNPLPTVTLVTSSPVLVCENQELKLEVQAVTGATYQWFRDNVVIPTATNATYTVASATAANAGTYRVEITTTATSCKASSSNITVTVNPQPIAYTVGGGGSYCAGGSGVNITLSGSQSGIRYDLLLSGSATGVSLTGTGSALTFTGITVAGSYSILGVSASSCQALMSGNVVVSINPRPIVSVAASTTTICEFDTVTLNAFGAVNYTWSGHALETNLGSTVRAFPLSTTTYQVIGVDANGCRDTSNITIIVNPRPRVTASTNTQTICSYESTNVSLISNVSGSVINVTASSSSPLVSGFNSATNITNLQQTLINTSLVPQTITYSFTGTAQGCTGVDEVVVVTVLPAVVATQADLTVCSGESLTFTPNLNLSGSTYDLNLATTNGAVSGFVPGTGLTTSTQRLFNSTNVPQIIRVSVLPRNGICTGIPTEVNITILPKPVVSVTSNSLNLCGSGSISISLNNNVGTGTYQTFLKSVTNVSGASSPGIGSSFTQNLVNTTNSQIGVVEYMVVGTVDGCESDTVPITVTILPASKALVTLVNDSICSEEPVRIQLNATVPGSTYIWSAIPSSNILGASSGSGTLVNQVLVNSSNNVTGTVTYRIRAVASGCEGPDTTVVVTVKPRPSTSTVSINPSFCIEGTTDISLSSSLLNSTISWRVETSGPVTGAFAGTGSRIVQRLTNLSRTEIGIVRYIASSTSKGCLGTPDTILVQVNPKPLASFLVRSDTTYCINTTVNLVNNTPPITGSSLTYNWDFGNGSTSISVNGSVVYNATGQYRVRLIAMSAEGCADTIYRIIRLVDIPRASFTKTTPTSNCAPVSITFTNTSYAPEFDSAPTWLWNFGNGQTSATGTGGTIVYPGSTKQDTTYYVTLTVTGRCGTSIYRDSVKVLPTPTARFLVEADTVCARLPIRISNNSIGQATKYVWSFGDGTRDTVLRDNRTVIHSFQHFGGRDTTFFVRLIASNLCGVDTLVQPVVVRPNGVFALFNTDRDAGCTPLTVNFTSNQSGSNQVIWIWGDGRQEVGGFSRSHTYLNTSRMPVVYRAAIIAFSGVCSRDTFYKEITVYPLPQVSFRTNKRTLCLGDTVTFTNTSDVNTTSRWAFGDNTFSSATNPPRKVYTTPGVYRITLSGTETGPFGCSTIFTDSVLVLPSPLVRARYTTDTLRGCDPLTVTFRLQTLGALSWRFDFGDGNSVANQQVVTHVYRGAGSYLPKLMVQGVCNKDSVAGPSITVFPSPRVQFTTDRPSYCLGDTLYLSNLSDPNLSYRWSSSRSWSSNLQNPLPIILRDTGLFTIILRGKVLTVPFCESQTTLSVRVHPKPIARFSGPGGVVLQACQGQPVSFTNLSLGANQVLWNFGVGGATSLVRNPTYTYTGSGLYKVHLTVFSAFGCVDTTSQFVNVYPAPVPSFTLSDTAGCSPLTVNFQNQTVYPSPLQGNLTWHLGNGLLYNGHFNVPSQTYTNSTNQPIRYRVVLYATTTFGCRDSVVRTVTVYPRPRPSFVALKDTLLQDSAVFTFRNTTALQGRWTYTWRWGNGKDTTVTDTSALVHRYNTVGRVRVTLLLRTPNGCADSITKFVTILPVKPKAGFVIDQGDTVKGCRPLSITVTNTTRFGRDYNWNFGNGVVYSMPSPPSVTYYNAGTFTIKLVVRNAAGVDSIVKTRVVIVDEKPNAAFTLNPSEVVIPDQAASFTNLSRGASSYLWSFGDGNTSSEKDPRHIYTDTGRYDVTLVAYSRAGCADTFSLKQAVKARYDGRIVIPNAFTPFSSGGLNDVFLPKMDGAVEYRMLIFSRWGEIMFESRDPNQGWDGRHRGQMCTPDQYVYRIEVTFSNGVSKTETGKVYLIR